MDQGTLIDCFYCTKVNSEKRDLACKFCQGKITYFRSARMMDRPSSDIQIFHQIIDMSRLIIENDKFVDEFYHNPKNDQQLLSMIEGLMEDFTIYGTNLEDIFIRILQRSINDS